MMDFQFTALMSTENGARAGKKECIIEIGHCLGLDPRSTRLDCVAGEVGKPRQGIEEGWVGVEKGTERKIERRKEVHSFHRECVARVKRGVRGRSRVGLATVGFVSACLWAVFVEASWWLLGEKCGLNWGEEVEPIFLAFDFSSQETWPLALSLWTSLARIFKG